MEKKDAAKMRIALKTVHDICKKEMGKPHKYRCVKCPANGERLGCYGYLCHHKEDSCCAPHRWKMDFLKEDDEKGE